MWFRGMFGTDGKKSHLIVFRKCQENLQDKASVTERLRRKDSAGGVGGGGLGEKHWSCTAKRLHVLQGLLLFLNVTFRSDDDDFNVSDAIMSRIFSSRWRRWSGIQLSCLLIHSVSKEIHLPRTYIHPTNTGVNAHRGVECSWQRKENHSFDLKSQCNLLNMDCNVLLSAGYNLRHPPPPFFVSYFPWGLSPPLVLPRCLPG